MNKVEKYMISLSVMLLTVIVSLLVVGTLTYICKWQADKAMIGIIVTYVLSGLSGGYVLRLLERRDYGQERRGAMKHKAIEVLVASVLFMMILLVVSVFALHIQFEWTGRVFIILGLIFASCFWGRIL